MDGDLDVLADHLSSDSHRRAGCQGTDVAPGVAADDDGEELVGGAQRRGYGPGHGIGVGLGAVEGEGAQARGGAPGATGQVSQLGILAPARQRDSGRQDPGLVVGVAHEELDALGGLPARLRSGLGGLTRAATCTPRGPDRGTDGGDGGPGRQEAGGVVGRLGAGGVAGQHDDLRGA